MHNKKAFTVVELIVVISILAILFIIAFVVFNDYAKGSRDSVRKADLEMIEKSIEMYSTNTGKYPIPERSVSIKYSGEEVWIQGVFGDSIRSVLRDFPYTPVDTLTKDFYAYSVTKDKKEFELATILESFDSQITYSPFPQTYAFSKKKARSYIIGNYNGILVKTQVAGTDYLLVTPSIIANNTSETNYLNLMNQEKVIYRGFGNLPASYLHSSFDLDGGGEGVLVNIGAGFVVFSGSLSDITKDKEVDDARIELIEALQLSYKDTLPAALDESIQKLLSLNTSVVDGKLITEVRRIVNNIFHIYLPLY